VFHSALGVAALKYLYMQWIRTERHPERFWPRVGRKVAGAALGSFALGVGVHLLVDCMQPKSVQFPFFGSLVDGTFVDDGIWLLGNSVWAFRIAREVFALSLAEELETARAYVRERFLPLRELDAGAEGARGFFFGR